MSGITREQIARAIANVRDGNGRRYAALSRVHGDPSKLACLVTDAVMALLPARPAPISESERLAREWTQTPFCRCGHAIGVHASDSDSHCSDCGCREFVVGAIGNDPGPARPSPTDDDRPSNEQTMATALAAFGWECGPEFWKRYYRDTWVFHLANAVERLTEELERLRAHQGTTSPPQEGTP